MGMHLDEKFERLLNAINVGLPISRAKIIAGLTPDEEAEIAANETYAKRLEYTDAFRELELLSKHEAALEIAVSKGNTAGLQWKLAVLYPERYGGTSKVGQPSDDNSIKIINKPEFLP